MIDLFAMLILSAPLGPSKLHIAKELLGVATDPSKDGDRTPSPAGSRLPVGTLSQRDPAAAQEELSVFISAEFVSMKLVRAELSRMVQETIS